MVSTDDGREMFSRGRLALENGDVAGAIPLLRSSADRFAADKNLRGEAAALANLGAAWARAGQFGPALQALMRACRMFGDMDPRDPEANLGLGTAMFSLASTMCDTGRSFDAAQTFETASTLLRAVGKSDLAEDAVRRRTTLLANLPTGLSKEQQRNCDEWSSRLAFAKEAAVSSRAIKDGPSTIRHFYNALEAAKALGLEETSASILENIGFELFCGGQAEEAISILREALSLSRRCGSKPLEGSIQAQLGNVQLTRGELQTAITDLEGALAIRRTLPDLGAVARTLTDLGVAHARSGNHQAAVEELSSTAKIYAAIGEQAMEKHLRALSSLAERGDRLINPGGAT